MRNHRRLGDILVPTATVDIETGKLTPKGKEKADQKIPVSANNQKAVSSWAKFNRWSREWKRSIKGKKIAPKMFAERRGHCIRRRRLTPQPRHRAGEAWRWGLSPPATSNRFRRRSLAFGKELAPLEIPNRFLIGLRYELMSPDQEVTKRFGHEVCDSTLAAERATVCRSPVLLYQSHKLQSVGGKGNL